MGLGAQPRRRPVGLDALHYGLLVALNVRKLAPPQAVADTLARAPAWLADLDQPPEAARLMLCLELLEMSLRFAEARRAGVTVRHDRFGAGPARAPRYAAATRRRYHERAPMSVSISSLISLAPIFGVVVLSVFAAFLLARGDDAARTRSRR